MQIPCWLSSFITALVAVFTLVAYYMATEKINFLKTKPVAEKALIGAGVVALAIFLVLVMMYFVNAFGQ